MSSRFFSTSFCKDYNHVEAITGNSTTNYSFFDPFIPKGPISPGNVELMETVVNVLVTVETERFREKISLVGKVDVRAFTTL